MLNSLNKQDTFKAWIKVTGQDHKVIKHFKSQLMIDIKLMISLISLAWLGY